MADKDQFDILTYPTVAGFKEATTSREAAEAIEAEGRAGRLREAVKRWFADGNQGTADECAAALGESILAIRPRVSELRNRGFLIETGERRQSSGGRMSHVWARAEMRQIGEVALSDVVEPLQQQLNKS
jgi:predicted ArsR family transcriptional regulator